MQREIGHYNLDMVIALGYRVQSPIAVLPPLRGTADFKKWVTEKSNPVPTRL